MKILDIAFKDFISAYRSFFSLVFMFGIPFLIAGMFYFMFGNIKGSEGFSLPSTKVVIANLDAGHDQIGQLGEEIVKALKGEEFSGLMEVTTAVDAAAARQAVDTQQAGVAIVIPENFSFSFANTDVETGLEIYKDPTLTIGPNIVEAVIKQITDGFAGVKIATNLALKRAEAGEISYDQIAPLIEKYIEAAQTHGIPAETLLEMRSPVVAEEQSMALRMVGPIFGGMMIFYAFFTGMSTGQSILREEEEGTLPRLFTTPTTQTEILAGKFLAIGLTVLVQVVVLIILSRLIFGIEWGEPLAVALFALGTIISASAFGVMVNSFLKNTKQAGVVMGGLLTVTGMVGMMDIFTGNAGGNQFGILPLFTPQGWAARSMFNASLGASALDILPNTLALLAFSLIFFVIGVLRFQKRYA